MCGSYTKKKKYATDKIKPILEKISKREGNHGSFNSRQLREEIAHSMTVKDYNSVKEQVQLAVNFFEGAQV